MMPVTVEIRRGNDRFVEKEDGRLTKHSLSFGERYDPANLRFGPMVCHDDHLLGRGRGFATHRHSDLLIVTYVVSGALEHTDASGTLVVPAGHFAVWRTGPEGEHSEIAAQPQTRFVQAWLTRAGDTASSYEVLGEDAVDLPDGAHLSLIRLDAGETATLPEAPLVHAYVVRGALLRSSLADPLQEGDAFRFTDEPAHEVTAAVPTELLVWTFPRQD